MLGMVGEDEAEWQLVAELNSPHRYRDNHYRADVGPCGPSVYTMVLMLADEILQRQRAETCCPGRNRGLPGYFGERWDPEGTNAS